MNNINNIKAAMEEALAYIGTKLYYYSETYSKIITYEIYSIKAAGYKDSDVEIWFDCRYDNDFNMTKEAKQYNAFFIYENFKCRIEDINKIVFLSFEDCYAAARKEYKDACRYYVNEICINDKCDYCADYCPVAKSQKTCKHYENIVFLDTI